MSEQAVAADIDRETDYYKVLVVGFGPAGAVAAGMLGSLGHHTLVIDRSTEIYDKPRAIAIDHEIMRHFDNMGIARAVVPHVAPFTASQHFGAQGQLIRQIDMVKEPFPLGYTPSMVFSQPPVEKILRQHADGFACVDVDLGFELVGYTQTNDRVFASIKDVAGSIRSVTADYMIGCDGASSTVRQIAGIGLDDLGFDEPWLVVDVQVHESGLTKLPQTSAQFCNPARPASFIIGPGNHRRWEIMLLPGEDPREMEKPENVWTLLSPWLTEEDGTLWRAAAYRFHALVAHDWRKGRVFIAGDAAHQQPPFIGQGMCQGLRDVANLLWKLDRVMTDRSPETLLETYGTERKRHVMDLTAKIKSIGEQICIRDPAKAAARDSQLLSGGGGSALIMTRQEIVPPLQEGVLAQGDAPARGTLFPQPMIFHDGSARLLDKVAGTGWRLFIDARSEIDESSFANARDELGLFVAVITGPGKPGPSPAALEERDGVLAAWFDRNGVAAVLVRPDHYVFSAARSTAEMLSQLSELEEALS